MNMCCSSECSFEEVNPNVFRCLVHEMDHHCDEEACDQTFVSEHGTVTCRWTGKCYEQRQQDHPFAMVSTKVAYNRHYVPPSRKRKRTRNPFRNIKIDRLKRDGETVLRLLLFSTTRESQNKSKVAAAKKKITKDIRRYQRTKGAATNKEDLENIVAHGQPSQVPIVPYDEELCTKYCKTCIHYWQYLATTEHGKAESSHIRYREMVVALLFLMRRGVRFDHKVVIPEDLYLQTMLPSARDLKHYGLANKAVTTASNQFMKSLRMEYQQDRLPLPILTTYDHERSTSNHVQRGDPTDRRTRTRQRTYQKVQGGT